MSMTHKRVSSAPTSCRTCFSHLISISTWKSTKLHVAKTGSLVFPEQLHPPPAPPRFSDAGALLDPLFSNTPPQPISSIWCAPFRAGRTLRHSSMLLPLHKAITSHPLMIACFLSCSLQSVPYKAARVNFEK